MLSRRAKGDRPQGVGTESAPRGDVAAAERVVAQRGRVDAAVYVLRACEGRSAEEGRRRGRRATVGNRSGTRGARSPMPTRHRLLRFLR